MSALMDEVVCPTCGVMAANASALAAHNCIDILRFSVSEAEAECESLRAEIKRLTTCDCGQPLSNGTCRYCDNDE